MAVKEYHAETIREIIAGDRLRAFFQPIVAAARSGTLGALEPLASSTRSAPRLSAPAP